MTATVAMAATARMAVMADLRPTRGRSMCRHRRNRRPAKAGGTLQRACPSFGSSRTCSQRSAGNSWTGRRIHQSSTAGNCRRTAAARAAAAKWAARARLAERVACQTLDNPTGCLHLRTRIPWGGTSCRHGRCVGSKSPQRPRNSRHLHTHHLSCKASRGKTFSDVSGFSGRGAYSVSRSILAWPEVAVATIHSLCWDRSLCTLLERTGGNSARGGAESM